MSGRSPNADPTCQYQAGCRERQIWFQGEASHTHKFSYLILTFQMRSKFETLIMKIPKPFGVFGGFVFVVFLFVSPTKISKI